IGAERERYLFFLAPLGLHQRNEFPGNKWKGDKYRCQDDAWNSKNDLYIMRLQKWSEPALGTENQDVNQTSHHWRHGKWQVNQGHQKTFAGKIEFGDGPGGDKAEDQIQGDGNRRDQKGELNGGDGRRIANGGQVNAQT